MAAPTPTARVAPTGIKLKDGYQALITFALDPNIEFWEKQVTPPGMDGGDPIDQTTMHNVDWRTSAPRALITLTNSSVTVAYDPTVYTACLNLINRETTITVTFSDGSTVAFFGFLKSFTPAAMVEGTQPEATIEIVPTNFDNGAAKVESGPAVAGVAGT